MSNVTLLEIANICAREFGTTLPAMRARHATGGKTPIRSDALLARNTAIWLARRHTDKSAAQIALFFCLSEKRGVFRASQVTEELLDVDRDLKAIVEIIEEAIDEIHEAKLDRMFAGDEGRAVA